MPALLFALALMTANEPAATATAPDAQVRPTSAPVEDYEFVAWCHGALNGYLSLHDQVMPEVTRIESTFRRPGSNLADDLAVYDQMQRQGTRSLSVFAAALESAEQASLQPISARGDAARKRGAATWTAAAVSKARLAQEWMSWTLPAACEPTAKNLEVRSRLGAAALQVNATSPPGQPAPAAAPAAP